MGKKDREDTEVKCVKRRKRDVWVTWRFEVPKKNRRWWTGKIEYVQGGR